MNRIFKNKLFYLAAILLMHKYLDNMNFYFICPRFQRHECILPAAIFRLYAKIWCKWTIVDSVSADFHMHPYT